MFQRLYTIKPVASFPAFIFVFKFSFRPLYFRLFSITTIELHVRRRQRPHWKQQLWRWWYGRLQRYRRFKILPKSCSVDWIWEYNIVKSKNYPLWGPYGRLTYVKYAPTLNTVETNLNEQTAIRYIVDTVSSLEVIIES